MLRDFLWTSGADDSTPCLLGHSDVGIVSATATDARVAMPMVHEGRTFPFAPRPEVLASGERLAMFAYGNRTTWNRSFLPVSRKRTNGKHGWDCREFPPENCAGFEVIIPPAAGPGPG